MPQLNLPKLEEEVQSYWEEKEIFREVCESKKREGKKFYFCQGPPFTSGKAHIGHAWNHALKDFVLRYKTMRGYDVFRRAGWDMHGLPIEVKVEEEVLKSRTKKDIEEFGIENFISECKEFSLRNMNSMTSQLKRLGAWLNWDNAYMTLDKKYMESVWFGIKRAYEQNLLYEDEQVIHWCPRCETAVAGYEVKDEYREVSDYSIYVKVQLKDKKEKILIWTTTPWTLPANVAIALHPDFNYVKVKFENEILILVKEKVEEVFKDFKEDYEILGETQGIELNGLEYFPILDIPIQKDFSHKIIMAPSLVKLEEGTGCVHIAPGHGEEDFDIGKEYKLKVLSPVNEKGELTAAPYEGLYVGDANPIIISDLEKSNSLLKKEKIFHRYPHCWRCKSPLLLRTTKQWFLRVSKLRERLIEKNREIEWIPEWIGSGRFENWLQNARDWCISRQRYWNTPLPIWKCESCGNLDVIGSIEELSKKSIHDLNVETLDLHRPKIDEVKLKCENCKKEMQRVKDVLDVWIDSGSASWANLSYPQDNKLFKKLFPADFITEGSDQTRGWFYSLLVSSVIAFDKIPYKRVLYHGFTLDAEGRKMSKSLGNVIDPDEMIKKYGADVFRFYVLSTTAPWEDLRFSLEGISSIAKMFNILWNSFEFFNRYRNLDNFSYDQKYKTRYEIEDLWILSKFNSLIEKATSGMEKIYPHEVTRNIHDFILELSRLYIKLVRERVWMEKNNESKLAVYYTLFEIFVGLSKLLAPISPHISEYIYRDLTNEKSVHLLEWPTPKKEFIDKKLEEEMEIAKEISESVKAAREKSKIKLRWPISRIIISLKKGVKIDRVKELILRATNAKKLQLQPMEEEIKVKLNFSVAGKKFKNDTKKILKLLSKINAKKIKKEIEDKGEFNVENFSLKKEDLFFEIKLPSGIIAQEFKNGILYIDSELSPELYSEAMAREVIRRIQEMRKEMNLNELEKVDVEIKCSNEFMKFVEENKSLIEKETRGEIKKFAEKREKNEFLKKWKIESEMVKIKIVRKKKVRS